MDKHRLMLIVIGVLGVGILAGGWFLGVSPHLDRIGRASDQTASVEQMNRVQETRNAGLKADFARLAEFRGELARARTEIPDARSQSELIDQVNAAAQATGVLVTTLTFDAPRPYAAPAGVVLEPPASARLIAVDVQIAASGDRAQLEAFARAVQTSARIVSIDESQYSGPDAATLTLGATTWVLQR